MAGQQDGEDDLAAAVVAFRAPNGLLAGSGLKLNDLAFRWNVAFTSHGGLWHWAERRAYDIA